MRSLLPDGTISLASGAAAWSREERRRVELYHDPSSSLEIRVEDLLGRLALEDKAG